MKKRDGRSPSMKKGGTGILLDPISPEAIRHTSASWHGILFSGTLLSLYLRDCIYVSGAQYDHHLYHCSGGVWHGSGILQGIIFNILVTRQFDLPR
jgi:hypothetical protein